MKEPKFEQKGSKIAQKWTFQHFLKIVSLLLAGNWLAGWTFMVRMYGTPSICLGEFSFGQLLGKTAQKP